MSDKSGKQSGSNAASAGISGNEIIALVIFFVLAITYAGWQMYLRGKESVHLGDDLRMSPAGMVVQVEGAVVSPGLVRIPEGSRVSDAIEAAGGFLAIADRDGVNLGKILENGERIDVPYLDDSVINRSATENDESFIRSVPFPDSDGIENSGLLNINTATLDELQSLPGIGSELASRIINHRNIHGPFARIEDILVVDGIGEAKFKAIKHLITAGN
ncbi:MAG TPA: ComEA family DNA-binding protein [Firmicutes bacterium]|nr:ComEA family DNA-binding protein [Bacillota bacterium]